MAKEYYLDSSDEEGLEEVEDIVVHESEIIRSMFAEPIKIAMDIISYKQTFIKAVSLMFFNVAHKAINAQEIQDRYLKTFLRDGHP